MSRLRGRRGKEARKRKVENRGEGRREARARRRGGREAWDGEENLYEMTYTLMKEKQMRCLTNSQRRGAKQGEHRLFVLLLRKAGKTKQDRDGPRRDARLGGGEVGR
jgi:hypothetical protein